MERTGESLNILQMNVRLSEGGAAGVAVTIHHELQRKGHSSTLVYGYGPAGRMSKSHDALAATRLTSCPRASANLALHGWAGRDMVSPSRRHLRALRQLIEKSDIVHLHAMHSYWFATEALIKILSQSGTPVVWTAHDHWLLTGRCAQPGECQGWRTGCGDCPDLQAYPPAKMDRTDRGFARRREQLARLASSIPIQYVACANWLAEDMTAAGLMGVTCVQNSVDLEFWNASDHEGVKQERAPRLLFMCRDLRDRAKVDEQLLLRIAAKVDLVIMGDHASDELAEATTVMPATNDRRKVAELMVGCDGLIFLSRVDYYPLTIAEAACAGLAVFALRSAASTELSSRADVTEFDDSDALLAAIERGVPIRAKETSCETRKYFAPERMADQYIQIYRTLLTN